MADRIKFGIGAARKITEDLVGGPIVENESQIAIQTSAQIALQGNGDRVALTFINVGGFQITLTLNPVAIGNGLVLGGGQTVNMSVREDFTLPSRTWYAIAAGGVGALYILEVLRVSLSEAQGL